MDVGGIAKDVTKRLIDVATTTFPLEHIQFLSAFHYPGHYSKGAKQLQKETVQHLIRTLVPHSKLDPASAVPTVLYTVFLVAESLDPV
jgi:hypothetical protein